MASSDAPAAPISPQPLEYAASPPRRSTALSSLARCRPACCRPVIWWPFVLIVLSFLLGPCVWVLWATFSGRFHP